MEDKFVVLLGDSKIPNKEFMQTIGPFTEQETRDELRQQGKPDGEIDTLLAGAKAGRPI